MAKSVANSNSNNASSNPADDAKPATPEEAPIKVELWDINAVKNNLDDYVKVAALKYATDFKEVHSTTDFKLWSSFIACVFASIAVVYGFLVPHPQSSFVVGICVCMYFGIVGILSLHASFFDKGLLLQARKDKETLEIKVFQRRFSHVYNLHLAFIRANGEEQSASVVKSVADFFYEDGELCKSAVEKTVKALIDDATKAKSQ